MKEKGVMMIGFLNVNVLQLQLHSTRVGVSKISVHVKDVSGAVLQALQP